MKKISPWSLLTHTLIPTLLSLDCLKEKTTHSESMPSTKLEQVCLLGKKKFLSFVDKEISLKEPSFIHLVYEDGPKTLLFIGTTYIMQNLFIDKHK